MSDPDTRYDFSDIESILFKSVDFRYNDDFTRSTFEAPVRFHGNQYDRWVSFSGATFQYPVDFEMVEFDRMASFWRTRFLGGARMTAPKFDGFDWFSEHVVRRPMFWYAARFRNDVDFDGSVFEGRVSFKEVAFTFTADFTDVSLGVPLTFEPVQAETLLIKSLTDDTTRYINLIGAEISDGQLKQPESGAVVYNFTDATLGEVLFKSGNRQNFLQWLSFTVHNTTASTLATVTTSIQLQPQNPHPHR